MAKNKNKKKAGPVLISLCIIAVAAYLAFAGVLCYSLYGMGILTPVLFIALVSVLALIGVIGIALTFSRSKAVKIISVLILFIMAGSALVLTVVVQDIDRTLNSMAGDTNTVSTPISVVSASSSGIDSISALAGHTVGFSADCSEIQKQTVRQQIENTVSGVSFVDCENTSAAIHGMLDGSCDAVVVPDSLLLILTEEIKPELGAGITKLETYIVTESYRSTVGVNKTYAEAPAETAVEAPSDTSVEAPAAETAAPETVPATASTEGVQAPLAAAPEVTPVPVTPEPVVEEPVSNSMLIYISGNDNYGDISIDGRSDVNIIAAVNFDTHKVFLVNTPRDYYLPISISTDGTADKITHCGIYGIQCSMDTLAAAYGVEFDHFFKVNFSGFINIIDAIGGIDVYNDFGFVDNGGNEFSMGDIHLNGSRALLFARNRHQVGINNRGNNHMKVIQAVVNKVIDSPEILLNYAQIMASLEGSFMTDLNADEIYGIINDQLADMRGWSFDNYSVSGEGSSTSRTYSMWGSEVYVVLPNYESMAEASRLINECLTGK